MYTKDDITIINWREHVAKNQEMYFGSRGANPESIASGIAEGALILGCKNVTVNNESGWWLISSDKDWLKIPNQLNVNESNAFESIIGFPDAGQNRFRSEALASLFSSVLITFDGLNYNLLNGNDIDLKEFKKLSQVYIKSKRIIGFKFENKA